MKTAFGTIFAPRGINDPSCLPPPPLTFIILLLFLLGIKIVKTWKIRNRAKKKRTCCQCLE
jgi:hypothetical protein